MNRGDEDHPDGSTAGDDSRTPAQQGPALETLVRVIAAALGGAVGLGTDPIVGASATPMIEQALRLSVQEIRANAHMRAAQVLEQASELAEIDVEQLTEQLATDDDGLQLLSTVLEAAARSAGQRHIRALARCLANNVPRRDEASIQLDALVARALLDLHAPHIRLLFAINVAGATFPGWSSGNGFVGHGAIVEQDATLEPVFDVLIAALIRNGAVVERPPTIDTSSFGRRELTGERLETPKMSGTAWRLTTLGYEVLRRLGYEPHLPLNAPPTWLREGM